jgi:broad specificity phosphatase PhoE
MFSDLILIRHARSTWNDEGRCQGTTVEPPLNPKGKLQAQIAAGEFYAAKIDARAIYSSDQRRAVETAEAIGARLGLPVLTDVRLREMEQGAWQGMMYPDIKAQYGELYRRMYDTPWDMCPPGGETMEQVTRRVFAALDDIASRHINQRVLVVSHEIPIAIVRCAAYGPDLTRMWDFTPHNCQPSRVIWPLARSVSIPGADEEVRTAA